MYDSNVVNFVGSDKKGSPAISRDGDDDTKTNVARSFAFKELVTVTQNFREANLIGEGGFGSVYKGRLDSGLVSSNHECMLPTHQLADL